MVGLRQRRQQRLRTGKISNPTDVLGASKPAAVAMDTGGGAVPVQAIPVMGPTKARTPRVCENVTVANSVANEGLAYAHVTANAGHVAPRLGVALGPFPLISAEPSVEEREGRPAIIFSPDIEAQAREVFSHAFVISLYKVRQTWAECRTTISS